MTNTIRGKLIKGFAVFVCVTVPLGATISQFPIWISRSSEATVSGLFLVFAFLSCIPFINQVKAWFKSPSVWSMFGILFFLFLLLRTIIDEMIVVLFFGFAANAIGAVIYRIGVSVEQKQ